MGRVEHRSEIEFCQATDNSGFKLECDKIFLRTKFQTNVPNRPRGFT